MLNELKHLVPHYDIGRELVISSEPDRNSKLAHRLGGREVVIKPCGDFALFSIDRAGCTAAIVQVDRLRQLYGVRKLLRCGSAIDQYC